MYKSLLLLLVFAYGVTISAQHSAIQKATIDFVFVDKDVKGTISGFESTSKIDWNDLENSFFEGSVAVETLDTNSGLRNWSLKSRKYFNESDYPRIYFKSTSVVVQANQFIVKGTLTFKGIEKPLTITFDKTDSGLMGKAELYTYDFGIKIKKERTDNLVKITFRFEQP